MDHPVGKQLYPLTSVQVLAAALAKNGIGQSSNVILLADTNDANPDTPTPDSTFMNGILGGTAKNVQGAGANPTCCCSDGTFPFKTDRIISNFGASAGPAKIVDLKTIFGAMAQCPSPGSSCVLGEMHKPVFWSLSF